MSMQISSQLISKLGSPDSRLPLAVKDIFNCAGNTYFSYNAGGKVEGKDRFIDEAGTGSIWLFGIPFFKKIIDKTLYKAVKISPQVDVRILNNKDYYKTALNNAINSTMKQEIQTAGENISKTKGLGIIKFIASLALTMASYKLLSVIKHNITKKEIEKEYLANLNNKTIKTNTDYSIFAKSNIFNDIENNIKINSNNQTPSFKANSAFIKTAENIMLNPVKNMLLLDLGISSERIINARTKEERKEFALKEFSFLFFVYGADKLLKKGLNLFGEKLLKVPAEISSELLASDIPKNILQNGNLQNEISEFLTKFSDKKNISKFYEFVFSNQDNIVVKAAKQSGLIKTIKDSSGALKIDARKYIDYEKILNLASNLTKLTEMSKVNNADINTYLNKIKKAKIGSTAVSIGVCCLSLGYIVPKLMLKLRQKNQNGKNDFHVKTEYEKELNKKYSQTLQK